jgi:hypothetical protein
LNIENERIDSRKHLVCRPQRLAVQAVGGKAGCRIFGRRVFLISTARDAMLRTEQRHKLDTGRMKKQFDRRAALRVEARVIGDQSNVLAAKRREFFRFENVESCLHSAGAARLFLRGMHGTAKCEKQGKNE